MGGDLPEFIEIQDRSCEQILYGLPLAGVRRLTTEEHREFGRQAKNRFAVYAIWFITGPAILVLLTSWFAYLWAAAVKSPPVDIPSGLLVVAYILSPFTIWLTYRAHKKWKTVKRSMDGRGVRVFKGMSRRGLVEALEKEHALPRGMELEPGRDVSVEMHLDHDVLIRVGDARVRGWKRFFVTKAAAVPERLEYGQFKSSEGIDYKVRKLTVREMKELRRYYRLSFRPWALISFLAAYSVAAMVVSKFVHLVPWVLVVIMVAGGLATLIIDLRRTLGFIRDARGGVVMAFTKAQMQAETPDFETGNPGLLESELVEVLPNTGIIWREGREPGVWRDGCR